MGETPYVSDELLKHFEEMIPEKCPGLKEADREIWFYAGKRSVVHLLRLLNQKSKEKKQHV